MAMSMSYPTTCTIDQSKVPLQPSPSPPLPPLLCLPLELRTLIYTYLLPPPEPPHADVPRVVEPEYSVFRDKCIYLAATPPPDPCKSGIFSLLLTCKQIHNDLRAYLARLERRGTAVDGAELDLVITGLSHVRRELMSLTPTWTFIPPAVPLSRWKSVVVNIRAQSEIVKFWGCGGPMPIGRHLLRLLGLFVEYGPGFRPVEGETQSSPPELALDEMVFIVTEEFEVGERKNTSPNPLLNKRILEEGLRSYLAVIACSGLLWRKVKRLRVIQRGGGDVGKEEDTEISVDDVEQVEQGKVDATAKQWGDYGWIPGRSTNLV